MASAMFNDIETTTLRQRLTQKKPVMRLSTNPARHNTMGNFPVFGGGVSTWDAFTLENLDDSYGEILDTPLLAPLISTPKAQEVLAGIAATPGSKQGDVKPLIAWTDGILKPTLELAKKCLPAPFPDTAVKHDCLPAVCPIPDAPHNTALDHITGLDKVGNRFLVAGFARLSSQVSEGGLEPVTGENPDESHAGRLWPLRQLANTCKLAKTRYGYILTDQEVLVCRFSLVRGQWKVEYMAVPWDTDGGRQLTTDLALWWLCMIAMADTQNRAIVELEELAEIDHWDNVVNAGGIRVRRHRYSKAEKPFVVPAESVVVPDELVFVPDELVFVPGEDLEMHDIFNIPVDFQGRPSGLDE